VAHSAVGLAGTADAHGATGNCDRLETPGKIDLELIEVQTGSYLGEDDIERLQDDYNR
jgi:hypothetical protein